MWRLSHGQHFWKPREARSGEPSQPDRCLQLFLAVSVLPHYLSISGHAKTDLPLSRSKKQEHTPQSMMLQEAAVTSVSLCHSPGNHLDAVLWTPLCHSHLVIRQLVSCLKREGGDTGAVTAPPWTPSAP